MNPSTGTFISMDTYQGSLFDPVSLHKYLYANANPITYYDHTGNMADAVSLNTSMTCCSIMDVAQALYDATCIAIGIKIIHKLRGIETEVCSKITELIFDLAQGIERSRSWSVSEWLKKLKAKILGRSIGAVIDSIGDRQDGDQVYYHATTLANALLIMSSKMLIGSQMEGNHVFAWRLIPNKKALKKSGAQSAEVIVAFSTFAAFEPDWGIHDPYVLQFQPVCTVISGVVYANKVAIFPII